jgi:type I restriction enzyme R subunit
LVKFDATGLGRSDEEIETTIRQVIDQALVSEQVIDVFDAAGIKKPDISILSEDGEWWFLSLHRFAQVLWNQT